jgi:DNA polymerase III epsilon subunit-like protein
MKNYCIPQMDDLVLCYVDCESTGLNPMTDQIIQLAAIATQGDRFVGTFNTFVNAETPISDVSQRITGITQDTIAEAPGTKDALCNFFDWVKGVATKSGVVFLAHNGQQFDFPLIWAEMSRYGLPVRSMMLKSRCFYMFDTLLWARRHLDRQRVLWIHGRPSFSLVNLHRALIGSDPEHMHDALSDCVTLKNICDQCPELEVSPRTCIQSLKQFDLWKSMFQQFHLEEMCMWENPHRPLFEEVDLVTCTAD